MPPIPQMRDVRSASVGGPPNPTVTPNRGLIEGLQAVSDAGQDFVDTLRKKQDDDDRIAAHKKQTEVRAKIETGLIERQANGEDLDGLTKKLPNEINAEWAKASAGMSKGAKRIFDDFLPDVHAQFGPVAARVEVGYKNTKREADITSALESARSTIITSPEQFGTLYAQNRALLNNVSMPIEAKARLEARLGALAFSYAETIGRRDPLQAKKIVQAGGLDKYGLDPDAKSRLIDDFDREAKRRATEAREQRAASTAGLASGIAVEINRFRNGQGDFDQALLESARKALSPDAFNRLQMQFDDARAVREGQDAERVGLAEKIEAGGHVDPRNAKETAAYDDYFKRSVVPKIQSEIANLPPEQQAQALTSRVLTFIRDQGVVPKSMVADVRSSLRSPRADDRVQAARMVEQLRTVAPRALGDFDDDTLRQANTIGAYVDGGMDPAKAVAAADEALRRPKIVDDALTASYREKVKTDSTADWLGATLDKSWWSDPAVSVSVAAEVDNVVRSEFLRNGGNLEAARRTGLDLVQKRFGVTTVNGSPTVTRNPIEQHYKLGWQTPEQAAEAIKAEAVSDVSNGWTDGALSADRVQILPYPAKGVLSPNGLPAYALSVQDSGGGWTVQMDLDPKSKTFGLPRPWWPAQAKAKAARDEQIKQAIETQKTLRLPMTEQILPQAGMQ